VSDPIYYDLNNKRIEPGAEVVFNQSGYLAVGKILEIKPDTRSPFRIEVLKTSDGVRGNGEEIAKVRHSWSIMVLSSPGEMSFDEYLERYGRPAITEIPKDRRWRGDGLSGILGTPVGIGSNE
jgi:hypothetical protein